jgi:hypothetical protein
MVLALTIFLIILLMLQCVMLVLIKSMSMDLVNLRSDLDQVRRAFVPISALPNVGARPVPSLADIAAARARAPATGPNQVDVSGIAKVGGPGAGGS